MYTGVENESYMSNARLLFDSGSQRSCITESKNGRFVNLELLVVPDICSPLSDQCPKLVIPRYPHIRN